MAEFSDQGGAPGNAFRPYAEPVGRSAGMYADLNPLEGLRGSNGSESGNALQIAGLPMDVSSLTDIELDAEPLDTTQAATELVKFAGWRLLSTIGTNPFSVAQVLLQVQCLPMAVRAEAAEREKDKEEAEDAPDPDDPAYYEYLRARHSGRSTRVTRAAVDHSGYVVRDGAVGRPGYELEALPSEKLAVLRRLVRQPTEGMLSMFKGALTRWIHNMLDLLLQPTLEGVLNEALGLYEAAYVDSAPTALTLVASSVVVGWLLSPLEVVYTRLIVQSGSPLHRKYRGITHALRTIVHEEGGLRALYLSPYHLVPTLIKHALDPIFANLGALAIDRAGIDAYDRPALFAAAGLAWKSLAAIVMLPIDTVRARLHAQPRYVRRGKEEFREFRTCVPTTKVPYTGMANCMWRVIAEEGESLPRLRRRIQSGDGGGVGHYGLRGLYPGLTLHLMVNVFVFGLGFIGDDSF
ncbi:hypothetical protein LPJ63_001422 [Coemansia sp. RSA 2711]|nr:hypothetical protein LPJ63_001422 [Coemansia sp. RSA 2711]KAJ2312895.1 hypothetical protein IWW54_001819 [Coemansia sp. RSA 2705]